MFEIFSLGLQLLRYESMGIHLGMFHARVCLRRASDGRLPCHPCGGLAVQEEETATGEALGILQRDGDQLRRLRIAEIARSVGFSEDPGPKIATGSMARRCVPGQENESVTEKIGQGMADGCRCYFYAFFGSI